MRTKEILMSFEEIAILCQFLYINKSHYVTVDNGMAKIEIRMNDNCTISGRNMNFPDLPDYNWTDELNIPNMLAIISQLKNVKPEVFKESFSSRWDEIRGITLHNMALNSDI